MLSEIFDRIALPDLQTIPGSEEVATKNFARWRVPDTDIVIAQVTEGPRQSEFLFSPATVARFPELHERVRHLPYKPGTVLEDAYERLFTTGAVPQTRPARRRLSRASSTA